jgi:hypothetical protein
VCDVTLPAVILFNPADDNGSTCGKEFNESTHIASIAAGMGAYYLSGQGHRQPRLLSASALVRQS